MKTPQDRRTRVVRQPGLDTLAANRRAISRFAAAMCEDGDNIILVGGAMTLGV